MFDVSIFFLHNGGARARGRGVNHVAFECPWLYGLSPTLADTCTVHTALIIQLKP